MKLEKRTFGTPFRHNKSSTTLHEFDIAESLFLPLINSKALCDAQKLVLSSRGQGFFYLKRRIYF